MREAKERREQEEREFTERYERRLREDPCFAATEAQGKGFRQGIKFVHEGWYVAEFFVEWDSVCPDMPAGKWGSGGQTGGYVDRVTPSVFATNIRIRATNATGLAWQPTRTIFERTVPKLDRNLCFKVSGTTLDSSVSECD